MEKDGKPSLLLRSILNKPKVNKCTGAWTGCLASHNHQRTFIHDSCRRLPVEIECNSFAARTSIRWTERSGSFGVRCSDFVD